MMRLHRFLVPALAFLAISAAITHAQTISPDSLRYRLVLNNGDALRCAIVAYDDSTVLVQTEFDTLRIPKNRVSEFVYRDGVQRRRPFHFLMPSASPAGPGGFAGNYELGMFYGGFGLGYGATISGGLTLIPGLPLDKQIYHADGKFTLYRDPTLELALGGTFTWITLQNPYSHIYTVATYPLGTGRMSAMLFYRVSGRDVAPIDVAFFGAVDSTHISLHYPAALGIALGFDAPAFGRDDMAWVGEIWNHNITDQRNTAAMIAFRLTNEHLSADFGLAFFTAPFIIPVTRFEYRF